MTPSAPAPGSPAAVSFDEQRFKDALSRFATGVTVVAGIEAGKPVGFTCQSFMSVSMDPPYVAVAPARTSTTWPRIAAAGAFCVNVLSDTQEELSRSFAKSGGDKFAGVGWEPTPRTGSPVLRGCLAWIDCRVELVHDAGDHELILGRVHDLGVSDGTPLLFYRSGFAALADDLAAGGAAAHGGG